MADQKKPEPLTEDKLKQLRAYAASLKDADPRHLVLLNRLLDHIETGLVREEKLRRDIFQLEFSVEAWREELKNYLYVRPRALGMKGKQIVQELADKHLSGKRTESVPGEE
jgi:hypothetical protein